MSVSITTAIIAALAMFLAGYLAFWARDIVAHKDEIAADSSVSIVKSGFIGGLVNFFDPLGIGAFAPQTALLKFFKQCPDRLIPGTMNVANCACVLVQALIFTNAVEVDPVTLVAMFVAAMLGAVLGAGFMSKADVKVVRLVMGVALAITGCIMAAKVAGIMPAGGDATALTGVKLGIGVAVNFALGALMTAGVGLYNPCMVLVALLGMDIKVAFPIMMCSCAFLMVPASVKFIKEGAYCRRSALAQGVVAIPSTIIASLIIGSMDVNILMILVVCVTFYTSITMFRAFLKTKAAVDETLAPTPAADAAVAAESQAAARAAAAVAKPAIAAAKPVALAVAKPVPAGSPATSATTAAGAPSAMAR